MLIYFSGTGNSKYIAELMAQQLNDSLADAAALIKSGECPSFESEKPYVFVFPIYAWRMPRVLEKWIRSCRFFGSKKVYFIATCGESIGAASRYIKKLARETDFEYMGTSSIVMPDNYIIMFQPEPEEIDAQTVRGAEERALELCKNVASGEAFSDENIGFVGRLESGIVNSCFYTFYIGTKKFCAKDSCISCGKCAKNCMLNNITMKEGKPVWGKNCTHCMACISKCPAEAIEYGKNTVGRRRYVFSK